MEARKLMLSATVRGLVHGPPSPNIVLLVASNPWDVADLRTNDSDLPGSHGGQAGADLLGMKRITLVAQIQETTQADALATLKQMSAAWAPGSADVELAFTDDSGSYVLFGRPRQAKPTMNLLGSGLINVECRFAATDPFVYSAAEGIVGTGAPTPPSGLVFPLVFPLVFGPAGSGGNMHLLNEGTAPSSRWKAAIVGPCSEPRLSVGGKGLTYGADVPAGQLLILEGRSRTATFQGGGTVHTVLTERNWWTLDPGDTEVQFSTADNQGAVIVTYRSAWW